MFFYNENRKAGQFFVEGKEMEKEKKMDMEISKMVNAIVARLG